MKVKYGFLDYNLLRTEKSREGIEKLIAEIGNNRLNGIAAEVKSIDILEFNDALPDYYPEEANASLAFTVNTYLNEFPEMEKYFPFGRPLLPVEITTADEYFIIHKGEDIIYAYRGTTAGSVVYEPSTIYHASPAIDLSDTARRAAAQGKFAAILDSIPHRTRPACTDNFVGIIAFATPAISEETLLQHLLYEATHEAVHLVTMPAIIKQGLDSCNEEKVDMKIVDGRMCMSRKGALCVNDLQVRQEFKSAIEIAAYSIGSIMHSLYNTSRWRRIRVKPSDYAPTDLPFIAKAEDILLKSGYSLKECNNLVQKEINLLFRELERLKKQ